MRDWEADRGMSGAGTDMEDPGVIQRPRRIAAYPKDIAYDQPAPAVLEELKRRNPVQDSGRRRAKHYQ